MSDISIIPLILDLAKIVLEYSGFNDRDAWNFEEDDAPIHDQVEVSYNYCSPRQQRQIRNYRNNYFDEIMTLPNLKVLTIWISHDLWGPTMYYRDINCLDFPKLESLTIHRMTGKILNIQTLTNLKTLILNQFSYVNTANMKKLTYLSIQTSNDFINLHGNTELRTLDLTYNVNMYNVHCQHQLQGLTDCIKLTDIKIIRTYPTPTTMDLTKCLELVNLEISNYVGRLDLTKNIKLKILRFGVGVEVETSLDLRANINLEELYLDGFDSAIIFGNPKLKIIHIKSEYNYALDLTLCPNIKHVYIGHNKRSYYCTNRVLLPTGSTAGVYGENTVVNYPSPAGSK